ncbi:MAG: hypothetical protein R3296_12885 [Oleiphilaceae bacterium]|nr:hypothetical protein [Oleiphilaceae bacterium]
MYKKTLISLAVASSLLVTGCYEDSRSDKNAGTTLSITSPGFDGRVWPNFEPVKGQLPIPSDLNFDSAAGDGSFGVAGDSSNPVIGALNQLSGASTVAPIVVRFNGRINAATVDSRRFVLTDPEDPSSAVPNTAQNVFLLELDYASDSPVQALSAGEPPTVVNTPANPSAGPQYTHEVVQLDGNSAIRILPQKPLNPLKRYIVVVTSGVKAFDGKPVRTSPTFDNIQDVNAPLAGPLQPIRPLLTRLWVPVAQGFLGGLAENGINIDNTDIALAYSFTTSNDKQVLRYMAEPAGWIADTVKRSVTFGAAKAAVEGGASSFNEVKPVVDGALATFTPSEALNNDGLAPCDVDDDPNTDGFQTEVGTFDDQFACVGTLVKTNFPNEFPEPKARSFDLTSTTDAAGLSAVLNDFAEGPGNVSVHQGFINLPYFLDVPNSSDGSSIRNGTWDVDNNLALVIKNATGFPIPQADAGNSQVLNYIFPFAKDKQDIDVPLLVMTPAGDTLADLQDSGRNFRAVIYQHGITTDRSAALAFGSSLIKNAKETFGEDLVVFAIDQPLHGVAPIPVISGKEGTDPTSSKTGWAGIVLNGAEENDSFPFEEGDLVNPTFIGALLQAALDENKVQDLIDLGKQEFGDPSQKAGTLEMIADLLARTVRNSGSTIPGLAPTSTVQGVAGGVPTERHFGYTLGADNSAVAMDFAEGKGDSGSLFINLSNFINNRDNLRQGASDLMNLRATIETLAGVSDVHFVGHSLGTVNGAAFVAAATASGRADLHISGAHLLTPVAGITRLLENSPSFAPAILGGLQQAAGLQQGDADLETFLNVNQATLDTVDPINFAEELAVSDVLLAQINGDRTTPNAADPRFSDNVQGFDTEPLDLIFPNGFRVESPVAPLSGSEALQTLMGAENTGVGSPQSTPAITRYLQGIHGTPVLPVESIAKTGDVLKNRTIAAGGEEIVSSEAAEGVFGEMVSQTLQLISSGSVTGGGVAPGVIQPD